MMKIGDRVTLTPAAVLGSNKRTKKSTFDWNGRVGTMKKLSCGQIGVLWDGRTSLDWFPLHALLTVEPGAKIAKQPVPGPTTRGPREKPTRRRAFNRSLA